MSEIVIPKLAIVISKARDGVNDYVQIMSSDFMSVNVVLVAGAIEVEDGRPASKKKVKRS